MLQAEQQHTTTLRDLAQARYRYLVAQLHLQSLVGQDRLQNIDQANAWLSP